MGRPGGGGGTRSPVEVEERPRLAAPVISPVIAPVTGLLNQYINPQPGETAPPPPPPSPEDKGKAGEAVQQAMEVAAKTQRKARGRAATLLTGGSGLESGSLMVSKRTLLGN
jgi:hypothetical protein